MPAFSLIFLIKMMCFCKGSVEMSFDLKVLKLRAIFRAEENGKLPAYLGSTIRGLLGHSMRDSVCVEPNVRCHLCKFSENCEYTAHFNSAGNIAGSVNPFVLYVPVRDKTEWKQGDLLTFDITVFGKSTMASDFYVSGILKMREYGWGASRLKFSPVQIMNVFDKSLIWSDGQVWTHNFQPFLLHIPERDASSVLLRFNSPTRVVSKQKLQRKLSFDQIIQAILTRIRLLMHAYEGVVLEFDEERLFEDAKSVRTAEEEWRFVDFKRYSKTYNRKLDLPSIEGFVRFEGDITPFTPLLEIGEVVQIGKNTTHGFGKYDLYYV